MPSGSEITVQNTVVNVTPYEKNACQAARSAANDNDDDNDNDAMGLA